MPKAKAHPDQMGFAFDAPMPDKGAAALAGLERMICDTVGTLLATDDRPREVIAAEMSVLLNEDISRAMLDAYSSPARTDHRVPMSRFFALIVVTDRQDLFRPLLRKIGISGILGEEIEVVRIGQLERTIAEAQAELRNLKQTARKIRGEAS